MGINMPPARPPGFRQGNAVRWICSTCENVKFDRVKFGEASRKPLCPVCGAQMENSDH